MPVVFDEGLSFSDIQIASKQTHRDQHMAH